MRTSVILLLIIGFIFPVFSQEGQVYAIYLAGEEEKTMPARITLSTFGAIPGSKIYLLSYSRPLKWKKENGQLLITLHSGMAAHPPSPYAWTFRITQPVSKS